MAFKRSAVRSRSAPPSPSFSRSGPTRSAAPAVRSGPGAAERRKRIVAVVARIPPGRVATYGQVAALAGLPRHAREVGKVLGTLPPGSELPWQRVINAAGRPSPRGVLADERHQRLRLEAEGVVFDARGRVDLERFGWDPERLEAPRRRPVSRDHESAPGTSISSR